MLHEHRVGPLSGNPHQSGYPSRVGGNGQGLIVVAANLNNLVRKEYMRGEGSRRGLICNLFVSHPHAKVGILSTEVCVHNMASAARPAAVNRTNI